MQINKKSNPDLLIVNQVEVTEPAAEALIAAERISGKSAGYEWLCAVVSQACTFDGKNLPPEEVKRLPAKDFLSIVAELGLEEPETSPTASSTLPGKASLETTE